MSISEYEFWGVATMAIPTHLVDAYNRSRTIRKKKEGRNMSHDSLFDVEIVHTVRQRGASADEVPYSRTTQEYGGMGEAAMNFTEKVFIADPAAVMVAAGMAKASKK